MELCKQVISLELAKKLKSLNVKQESLWYWVNYPVTNKKYILVREGEAENWESEEVYSAFTVAELLEILKPSTNKITFKIDEMEDTVSDFFAKSVIYGIENGYIKVENIG